MNTRDHISPLPPDVSAQLAGMPAAEQAALIEAWMLAGDAPSVSPDRRAADWNAIQHRIRASEEPTVLRLIAPLRLALRRPYAVAATAVVLIGLLSLFSLSDRQLVAPVGGELVTAVSFPDGSTALLSPGSSIRYGRDFGDGDRHVLLDGEAFFDVQHAESPFRVETFNAEVMVLGTAFNVRAWSGSGAEDTRVFVARGSVRVSSETIPDMDVRLRPGEATVVAGEGVPTPPVLASPDQELAWRNGGMAFADAPIGDLLDEVERRFNVDVRAPEDVRLSRISYFKYSVTDADEILSDVVDATGLRYRRMSRGYEIYIP